ncbi:3-mercaptopyruvate sulfurtransferase [Polaribacter huanghezhanensis]|uniref:sulfurtransferase n=1 Tax=Polaribacter huanghezhanensis TaxID=1354726 RepID=UPI002649C585|nr:sulfurtransferase [Polaribacter huanghezhanensis]WKD86458.1 3-mercaptopyruvate sulfurtransferase [Polaribacter huanghezhanensis]
MENLLQIEKPLVSVNWLYQHKDATNLIVLEGTIPKVSLSKIDGVTAENQIPNTRFFDLKKTFSIQGAAFPNTAIKPKDFEREARKLGINKNSCIVVYDMHGIYSSPRVWWLFKSMGFDNIAVLDGGFPAWEKARYPIEKKQTHNVELGDFEAKYHPEKIIDSDAVLRSISNGEKQVVDARSVGRFNAAEPEPRKEIRSGHIPTSTNLPFASLLNTFELKSKEELEQLFLKVNPSNKALVFSCGSGITACILALGATIVGYKEVSVYDGSWTEWGSLPHLPIE